MAFSEELEIFLKSNEYFFDILLYCNAGYTNEEIADKLGFVTRTVKKINSKMEKCINKNFGINKETPKKTINAFIEKYKEHLFPIPDKLDTMLIDDYLLLCFLHCNNEEIAQKLERPIDYIEHLCQIWAKFIKTHYKVKELQNENIQNREIIDIFVETLANTKDISRFIFFKTDEFFKNLTPKMAIKYLRYLELCRFQFNDYEIAQKLGLSIKHTNNDFRKGVADFLRDKFYINEKKHKDVILAFIEKCENDLISPL